MRDADEQFGIIRKALADSTKVPAPIRASMDSLKKDLDAVKKKLGIRTPGEDIFSIDFSEIRRALPFKISGTSGDIGGAHAGLSETNRRTLGEVRTMVPAAVVEVNALLPRLQGFYRQVAEAGLYPKVPEPVK